MSSITLSLGSNIGDRVDNLKKAISILEKRGLKVIRVSSFYETEPQGYRDQNYFVNCVLAAETDLSPDKLLQLTQGIEREMKRVKLFRWGPRVIDVDILTYDDIKVDSEELTIPHPRMLERAFVLVPLAEIDPRFNRYLADVDNQEVTKIPECR